MQKRTVSLLVMAWLTLGVTFAGTLTVDFEKIPGPDGLLGTADDLPYPCGSGTSPFTFCGSPGTYYSPVGLTFLSGTVFRGGFMDGNPNNHFISSTVPDVLLSIPVYGVSITSYSYWTAILYAFDSGGNELARATLINPLHGSALHLGTVSLQTISPIARFTLRPLGCAPDQPCGDILNTDNFVLSSAAVPEPGTAGYVAAAAGVLLALRRRLTRSRQRD